MQLKVDLHTHSGEDPVDRFIKHSARSLVERTIAFGYHALAITNHTNAFYNPELDAFAEDNGLVLIPGMESNVQGKHVLLYCPKEQSVIDELNARSREANGDLSFKQVAALKERGIVTLVMAPHPYFLLACCIGNELAVHNTLFDLAEESWYATSSELPDFLSSLNFLNRNQKARLVANRFGIALFAASDAHHLGSFGRAYSIVEAEHTLDSIVGVLQSRDQSRITLVNPPVPLHKYISYPFISYPEYLKYKYLSSSRTNKHS